MTATMKSIITKTARAATSKAARLDDLTAKLAGAEAELTKAQAVAAKWAEFARELAGMDDLGKAGDAFNGKLASVVSKAEKAVSELKTKVETATVKAATHGHMVVAGRTVILTKDQAAAIKDALPVPGKAGKAFVFTWDGGGSELADAVFADGIVTDARLHLPKTPPVTVRFHEPTGHVTVVRDA